MWKLLRYYGNYQGFRSSLDAFPAWARLVVGIVALPGILLIALSILALCVSVLALLLLSVPVYRLLKMVTGPSKARAAWSDNSPVDGLPGQPMQVEIQPPPMGDPAQSPSPRRHVDVKIVE
jgi:hypothetical protein